MPKRKSFFKKFGNDGIDFQQDLVGNTHPPKKQKMHQTKSLTKKFDDHKEIAGQYYVNTENKKDRDVAKKKTFTENFFDADFDSLNFLNEHLINNKCFKEDNKEPHKNKQSNVEINDLSISVQHVTDDKSGNEEPIKKTKKRHKRKSSSIEGVVGQHNTKEEFLKEELYNKDCDVAKKTFSGNCFDADFDSLNFLNDCLINNKGFKEKKGSHKNKKSNMKIEGGNISVCHVTDDKSGNEEPVKKTKKRHKRKSFSMEDEGVVVQHNTKEEFLKEELYNKNSDVAKKTFTGNCFDADFDSLNFLNDCLINNKGFKEKKGSHKNKPSNMKIEGESISVFHVTDDKSGNEEPVKKTKKRHKRKSFSMEDEGVVVQHNTIEESAKEKKILEENKSKLSSTEVHYEDCFSESDVDNPSPISNHSEKNIGYPKKRSDKNKKGSSNTIPSSSDEEICDIGSSIQFITRCLDFKEEPVEFEVPLLHSCESVQQIGEEEREALKSKGISFKMGRFSGIENALLKRNYEEFTRRFGVNDPQLLLGLGLKCRNLEVAQFLKAKHFYVRLGKDLNNRPLCYIYKKARMLFDPRQKQKRLDATKVTHLKKAHDILGNKWHEIGNIINRSSNTARSAFFWHDEPVNHGKWTDKEEKELIKAIKTVLGVTDLCETEVEGISWENVAHLVPTRNFHQCRLYWFENLSWKFKDIHWDRKDFSKLVSILSRECYVEDWSEIDWKEVQKCFGDLSPSWQFLRKKWYSLKKELRNRLHGKELFEKMTYKQMLDYFCAKYKLDIENKEGT